MDLQTTQAAQFDDDPMGSGADALAGALGATTDSSGSLVANSQFVTFSCGQNRYGIDIMAVREIRSWSPVTQVPDQPHAVRGVLDIRGQVVQVFDLNLLLGSGQNEVTNSHVVIIVAVEGKNVGILVDAVSDIINVGEKDMRPPPSNSGGGRGVISGMAKHNETLFSLLNLAPLLGG